MFQFASKWDQMTDQTYLRVFMKTKTKGKNQ